MMIVNVKSIIIILEWYYYKEALWCFLERTKKGQQREINFSEQNSWKADQSGFACWPINSKW